MLVFVVLFFIKIILIKFWLVLVFMVVDDFGNFCYLFFVFCLVIFILNYVRDLVIIDCSGLKKGKEVRYFLFNKFIGELDSRECFFFN